MIGNKYFLIGLHLLVTYHVAKTFVLLSANIDDIRKLAKEFSGPLTDEIVKIILKATKNVSLDSSHENEAEGSIPNPIKPKKKKNKHNKKSNLRNNFQPIEPADYFPGGMKDRNTPKYSYIVSPKIHNFAEVNNEVKTPCSTAVTDKAVMQSYYVAPQPVEKNSNTVNDDVNNPQGGLNNAPNEPATKKRDTSTKLIEYHSSQEMDLEFHPSKKSKKKKKKKKSKTTETMETMVITNKEITKPANKEKTKDKVKKAKAKKQKTTHATILTDETTIHETTVDIELQKFENEVRGYMKNQIHPRLASKITNYQNVQFIDTKFDSVKKSHPKSKQIKTQTSTPTTTVSLQKLSKKVERLNQYAEHLLGTSKKLVSKRPTPAYPKHDYVDYQIPSSEFKLSYNPNENVNPEEYSKMYAKYLRNQMNDVDQRSTLDKLTDVIKKIFENRLGSRLMNTNDRNRRLDIPSHNMRALTRSEEDRIYEIIKMMVENRKTVEAKYRVFTKLNPYESEKRSTVHAFNIHKMSPEEKMADVIHKMVDSSLKIQYEKPQMSIGALSETLKNKPYENHGVNNEFKVSDMIQNLIEKKIAEYAKFQTTAKVRHVQRFHTENKGTNDEDRPWPHLRPSYETARTGYDTRYTSLPIRFQTQTRPLDERLKEIELEYQRIKTSKFKLAEESSTFREETTSKWQAFQHTQLEAQGSTIKIGREGPISIVIEDKTSDEIKRPVPQLLLLQNTGSTHKPDHLGYFLENRYIETTNARSSHWPKQTYGYMMEKNTREDKNTKNTETTTMKHSDIRSGNQGNGGGSHTNGIPNVQVVFLNVPQVEAEEERQKLEEIKKEANNLKEISKEKEKGFQTERQENAKKALRQKIEDEIREKLRMEEQKRMEAIRKLEAIRMEELKRIEEEKRMFEEKRIQEQKRLQAERQEYEKKVLRQKIEDELREKFRKEEEEKRKQEEKRLKEEKRQEIEKKAFRQKIENEMKEKEALDRKWEKELERKIKAKEMAAAIDTLKEEEKKKNEAEKKIIDQKILIMQEKLKRDLEETLELKLQKDKPSTDKNSQTLNYWEQQWQDDQELKLREEYYKYMKLHNATSGQSDKTLNYWSEQWRIDLENKLREKQKEDNEKSKIKPTSEIKEHTEEPSSTKFASNKSVEEHDKIEEDTPIQIVHKLLPRDKSRYKLLGGGGLIKNKKNIATSSAMPKPNHFDARRDDDNLDTNVMPDETKRLKLIIRRARDRSDGVTALQEMSDENTEMNDDVIRSDTIMKETEIDWGKPERSKINKNRINGESTEKATEVDRVSEVNISGNKMENNDTDSEIITDEHNILRAKSKKNKKGKLRHKKVKKEKFEVALKGEGKIEDTKLKKKNKKKSDKKVEMNKDHEKKNKNEKEHKRKKNKKSKHKKKISDGEKENKIHVSEENKKNEKQHKEHKKGKLKTKAHKKKKNKVKMEHNENDEKDADKDLKEHEKVKDEDGDGEIKEQKHKTKKHKRDRKHDDDDELDREHKEQEEEIQKAKENKKTKEKVKKVKQIKGTSKKHKKGKEKHKDDDHFQEKEKLHENGDKKSKHKKDKATKPKNEKSERNTNDKKKHKNKEGKENKKKEDDDDDGGREFDFNLMIGQNQKPTIRIPKHKKNKNKSDLIA